MKTILSLLVLLAYWSVGFSAEVDTVAVYSASMKKTIKTVVVRPSDAASKQLPSVYLLHGYGGDYSSYVERCSNLKTLVDQYQIVAICPDGGVSSWYWDSSDEFQYETFVTKELPEFIRKNYGVSADPAKCGVTGFSMGGHGALFLALRHPGSFAAVASTAGGVDFRPFPNNWEISKRLGSYAENPQKWDAHTVMESLHLYQPNTLAIHIDCGKDDFFFGVNKKLHEEMTYRNIPHEYLTMPGKHTWDYTNISLLYQFVFFDQVLNKAD